MQGRRKAEGGRGVERKEEEEELVQGRERGVIEGRRAGRKEKG